jgi:hypothetical protein
MTRGKPMFKFTVKPDDADEFEAIATSRDVVMWEKLGKGRSVSKFAQGPTMADLYSLAHVTCRRLSLFSGSLDDFEKSVDLEFEQGEAADPTSLAR